MSELTQEWAVEAEEWAEARVRGTEPIEDPRWLAEFCEGMGK